MAFHIAAQDGQTRLMQLGHSQGQLRRAIQPGSRADMGEAHALELFHRQLGRVIFVRQQAHAVAGVALHDLYVGFGGLGDQLGRHREDQLFLGDGLVLEQLQQPLQLGAGGEEVRQHPQHHRLQVDTTVFDAQHRIRRFIQEVEADIHRQIFTPQGAL